MASRKKQLAKQWDECSYHLECYRIEYKGQPEYLKGQRFRKIGDAYLALEAEYGRYKMRAPRKDYHKKWAYRDAWHQKIIACHWTELYPDQAKPNPPVPERNVYEYPPVR